MSESTHIVLVPGYWLGGWAWEETAEALRARGHAVSPLTLPGLEPDRADRSSVGPDDQAAAVVAALESRPAERALLVAHSGGAVPATVALDRRPDLVDHVVYVDTGPVADGFAVMPDLADDELPLPPWDQLVGMGNSLDGLSEADLERFRDRAVPQPGRVARERVHLVNPERFGVPGTMVCCSLSAADVASMAQQGVPFLAAVGDYDFAYVDLPTGHWPMWSRPGDLAELIHRIAVGRGAGS